MEKEILNRAKAYYENNKEIFTEQARNKYRELSNEEKDKKEIMEGIDTKIYLKKINKD